MSRYLVLGAGMMGPAIAGDLSKSGYVTLADYDAAKAEIARQLNVDWRQADVTDIDALSRLMESYDVAVSAVRYDLHYPGALAAVRAGCHFCDLGTDPVILKEEFALDEQVKEAGITIIPDCGVSPGITNILAGLGSSKLDKTEYIRLRVGGIPLNPVPPLLYTVVASIPVIVNEYTTKAEIIRDGEVRLVDPLSGLERIEDFPEFGELEAFYAACGTSTLPRSFRNVRELDDKTIRYAGHCEQIKQLLEQYDKQGLIDHLLRVLPKQEKDALLLRVTVGGRKGNDGVEFSYTMADRYDEATGMTAMARTTAWSASIIAQMIANGRIDRAGVLEQELHVPHQEFLDELDGRGIRIDEGMSKV